MDYINHQNYYRHFIIDLSGHENASITEQINFEGKLEEDVGATMLEQKTILNFSFFLIFFFNFLIAEE